MEHPKSESKVEDHITIRNRKLTFGSFFAGIGGLDLGLERAGMECRWQVEIDPFCQRILAKHWPDVKRYGDIKQLTGKELEPVDVVCGGFPCQDLSVAGKQVGIEGTRSGLWFEYARLIGQLRPRYVLIENVSGLLVYDAMRRVVGELARLGYVGVWRSFRASDFGASHLRKRIFIVAHSTEGSNPGINTKTGNGWKDSQRRGCELAYSGGERCREERQLRHGGDVLADASDGQLQEPGRGPEGRNGVGSTGPDLLPNASGHRLPDAEQEGILGSGRRKEGRTVTQLCGAFAPGPADPRWPHILSECPCLAPSLESTVRGVVDGIPNRLDRAMSNRTKRLSKLGNAVVPQIAEWMGRRIISTLESESSTNSTPHQYPKLDTLVECPTDLA